jgi:20S proteasome alpha/beta subunit
MTIAAGFLARDGLLLCADTLWTDGLTKEYREKIFSWTGKYAFVSFAVAGHSDHAAAVVDECKGSLRSAPGARLSIRNVLDIIRPIVKDAFSNYIYSRPYEEWHGARFELLVGVATAHEGPSLFAIRDMVPTAISGFECIGGGRPLARQVIGPSYHNNMTVDEIAVLGILALAATKQIVDGVGGQSQFVTLRKGFVSGVVPHDVNKSEPLTLDYQRRATNLLLDVADPKLNDGDLREKIVKFGQYVQDVRKEWAAQASPFRELREHLLRAQPKQKQKP